MKDRASHIESEATLDQRWMRRALQIAVGGRGHVEPNPMVGAVVVKDGALLGEGFHREFGGPHAEAHAIAAAGVQCRGATLYVTLAPCTGTNKKTPPCCDAVIAAGFERVVIGMEDPTQESATSRLKAAGLLVTCGVLEQACRQLVAPFIKLRRHGKPYVIAKWAMTADGKIATVTGDSRWISSDASRELVHQWRAEVDGVLVGLGTAMQDDPMLTCRIPGGRNPRRIVLDADAELPLGSNLVRSAREVALLIACSESAPEEACRTLASKGCEILRTSPQLASENRDDKIVNLEEVLQHLGREQVTNLLVEGGSKVFAHMIEHRMVDEVRIFIAPKLVGGGSAPGPVGGLGIHQMADALCLKNAEWRMIGEDMLLRGLIESS